MKIFATYLFELTAALRCTVNFSIVFSIVLLAALAILNLVLDHGNQDDEAEGHSGENWTVLLANAWHKLQKDQETEVSVD